MTHGGLVAVAAATTATSTYFVPIAVALITTAGLIAAAVLGPIIADRFRKRRPDTTEALLDALEHAKELEVENKRLKARLAKRD